MSPNVVAAISIDGTTLHAAPIIPVEHWGCNLPPPSDKMKSGCFWKKWELYIIIIVIIIITIIIIVIIIVIIIIIGDTSKKSINLLFILI